MLMSQKNNERASVMMLVSLYLFLSFSLSLSLSLSGTWEQAQEGGNVVAVSNESGVWRLDPKPVKNIAFDDQTLWSPLLNAANDNIDQPID